MNKHIITTAERITMDYANLSGRESANRAEFRTKTLKHLDTLINEIMHLKSKDTQCVNCHKAITINQKIVWEDNICDRCDF